MKIEKRSSNYENVENDEVTGCAIDIVGCGNHWIRGPTEGRASATAKRRALCVRLGNGFQDSAENKN
jgi:hypothetical protein